MGAYYSRSKGCYALVHGIGRGYDLWLEDNPDILPRWFHRVWTIQEFALPTNLMFVTKLPKKVHEIANILMRKANSSAGFCRCCIFKEVLEVTRDARSPMELLQSSGDDNGPTLDDSIDFSAEQSALVCSECRTPSLVKRGQRTISGGSIYMVEREAYLYLLFLDSFLMMERTTSVRIAEVMKSLERVWDPWMVVAEVATRQCTYEEDRILGTLGLLGVGGEMQIRTGQSLEEQLVHVAKFCHPDLLLKICTVDPWGGVTPGMSWAPNFRVPDVYRGVIGCGIHVRNVYRNFGHYVYWRCCAHLEPGRDRLPQPLDIAWLETSTMANLDDEAKITRFSEFKRQVEVLNVTHHGIMLKGKAVVGGVIPHERLDSKDQEAIKAMMAALSPPRSEQGSSAQMEEYEEFRLWRKVGGEIESPTDHTPTHCIKFQDIGMVLPLIVNLRWSEDPFPLDPHVKPFPQLVMAYVGRPQNPILVPLPNNQGALNALQSTWRRLEDPKIWIDMELWVVLLGTIGNENHNVAMACVGPKGNTKEDIVELHKVGILVLPIQIGNQLFGTNCQGLPKFYKLGGFGDDLSEFAIVRVATE